MPRAIVKRHPWVAAILSLLLPGLGHVYCGDLVAGLTALLVSTLFPLLGLFLGFGTFQGFVAVLVASLATFLTIAARASLRARRVGAVERRWCTRWYSLGLILLVANLAYPRIWSAAISPLVRFRAYRVPTSSMEPTLLMGDQFFVDTWQYRTRPPQRGEIAVFRYPPAPDRDMAKRCIAIPGDSVEIIDKCLIVNDVRTSEPYAVHTDATVYRADAPLGNIGARDNFARFELPEGFYFFLGDNRDKSYDSRFWGPVETADIKAKALYVYWSSDRARIGTRLE
jgi:signal peptidase I